MNTLIVSAFALLLLVQPAMACLTTPDSAAAAKQETERLAALDTYWQALSRTVREGDFEGYQALYHDDAVIVMAVGKKPRSMPAAHALESWKQGFIDTKAGKQHDKVEFRFTQRLGDATTAHETGMFVFTSTAANGELLGQYIAHFEMLLVKRNGKWLCTMEYQKAVGTLDEWDAMK